MELDRKREEERDAFWRELLGGLRGRGVDERRIRALELRDRFGRSWAEIAAELGVGADEARALHARALDELEGPASVLGRRAPPAPELDAARLRLAAEPDEDAPEDPTS